MDLNQRMPWMGNGVSVYTHHLVGKHAFVKFGVTKVSRAQHSRQTLWHSVQCGIISDGSVSKQRHNRQTIAEALSPPARVLGEDYLCPSVTHVDSLSGGYTLTDAQGWGR